MANKFTEEQLNTALPFILKKAISKGYLKDLKFDQNTGEYSFNEDGYFKKSLESAKKKVELLITSSDSYIKNELHRAIWFCERQEQRNLEREEDLSEHDIEEYEKLQSKEITVNEWTPLNDEQKIIKDELLNSVRNELRQYTPYPIPSSFYKEMTPDEFRKREIDSANARIKNLVKRCEDHNYGIVQQKLYLSELVASL